MTSSLSSVFFFWPEISARENRFQLDQKRGTKLSTMVLCRKPCLFLQFAMFFVCLLTQAPSSSTGSNSIFAGQSLSGNQTINSPQEVFELGFFSPGKSQNYDIGIWYKIDKTPVWVANRNNPVSDPSLSSLKLYSDGNLVLLSPNESEIWSTNSTSETIHPLTGELLDSGNFVLRNTNSTQIIWQSFDHLTDTWLPDSKLVYNMLTGERKSLRSWNSSTNPAAGVHSAELGPFGLALLNESDQYWGVSSMDFKHLRDVNFFCENLTYADSGNEIYLTYRASLFRTRIVLDTTGQLQQFRYDQNRWKVVWRRPDQVCGSFGFDLCGDFGICNNRRVPVCECMQGFTPIYDLSPTDTQIGGCQRAERLRCEGGGMGVKDTFIRLPNIQHPFHQNYLKVDSIGECESACLNDCSCSGFFFDNVCFIWEDKVERLQVVSTEDNISSVVDFYYRLAVPDEGAGGRPWIENLGKKTVVVPILVFFGLCCFALAIIWTRREKARRSLQMLNDSLMVLKYQDLKKATKNFSEPIGEGAFGCVYKGALPHPNSSVIAVKKLSSPYQNQSLKQFRAEVSSIGIIQHINLVRLQGFCIHRSTRFLIYEYMPNRSLASRLFKKEKIAFFSWTTRYNIALGIAKGLAYLHENCRDCIIHCDIKPENILLDEDYNPKVADFGLAKILGRDFSRVLTTIRGTRGYLAPEWMSGEAITPKVDVFSYGQLLFEIISGKRNIGVAMDDTKNYFPIAVSNALNSGDDLKALLDYKVGAMKEEELIRACKVACWCIQEDDKCRPSMSQVIGILEGTVQVGLPPVPRFFKWIIDDSQSTGGSSRASEEKQSSSSSSLSSRKDPEYQN